MACSSTHSQAEQKQKQHSTRESAQEQTITLRHEENMVDVYFDCFEIVLI